MGVRRLTLSSGTVSRGGAGGAGVGRPGSTGSSAVGDLVARFGRTFLGGSVSLFWRRQSALLTDGLRAERVVALSARARFCFRVTAKAKREWFPDAAWALARIGYSSNTASDVQRQRTARKIATEMCSTQRHNSYIIESPTRAQALRNSARYRYAGPMQEVSCLA